MEKVIYLAVLEPDGAGGYGVYYPDLPGCISAGDDLAEALDNAAEALGLHLYGMEQDGEDIPSPSKSIELEADAEPGTLVCPVAIFPALVKNQMDNQRIKVNLTIPAWVRAVAEKEGINCSRLLETAILEMAGLHKAKDK